MHEDAVAFPPAVASARLFVPSLRVHLHLIQAGCIPAAGVRNRQADKLRLGRRENNRIGLAWMERHLGHLSRQ